jgi:GH15 family glucan-1,4-alpha-glucosidase
MAQSKSKKAGSSHPAAIEDYALIGDCETAALVSKEGSIDWLCWPSFSSPACFAALLGTHENGFWKIGPTAKVKNSRRQYRGETLILDTTFETAGGEVCVTDFMPVERRHSHVIRIVRGVRGAVKMRMDLAIRFDYGRTIPWVTSNSELRAVSGADMVVLHTKVPVHGEGPTSVSEFTVRKGEKVSFTLTYGSSLEKIPTQAAPAKMLKETEAYWTRWMKKSCYRGEYADTVSRSLMVLKAMTYRPSGGIVAAVTTSLPERIGGVRNWDYRYCWLRDTAFTLLVLLRAGYRDEASKWRRWLLRAVAGAPDQVQTIYGLSGERDLNEWEADWLPGYRKSRPVRIGNGASGQFQLDVYGEVASALVRMPEAEDDIRTPAADVLISLVNHLCKIWHRPDRGIWEVRGGPKHFVHSKVLAWVAVDRAIRFFERNRDEAQNSASTKSLASSMQRWKRVRAAIHDEVCKKGFNRKLNSFVQAYGPGASRAALDASCLRIVLVGFLPPNDPRIIGTVNAIEKALMRDGLVQRYKTTQTDDGLSGTEGEFLACSFWMVINLWLIGRKDDAREMFERLLKLRNDVGLLSEEYDLRHRRMLGNFPQALSHLSLAHAAFTISGEWSPQHFADGASGAAEAGRSRGRRGRGRATQERSRSS